MSRNIAVKASVKAAAASAAVKSPIKAEKAKAAAQPKNTAPSRRLPERVASNGLSESALRKAPVAEYMSAAQLVYFRELLLENKKELIENAGVTSEHLREHEVEPDPTDQATIEEEYALELRARDRERKLLKKIEQSLRHIDDGSYGWCEETGEPIGILRLLARPTATLTVEAQSRRELKQKLYGD
ncbi:MAG: RNA polymerase-binding protein DksA [Betaproteobacteria bacterium]|nr:RNA polymerase-binding protein DksA [Betaproteobacteria bacterium]